MFPDLCYSPLLLSSSPSHPSYPPHPPHHITSTPSHPSYPSHLLITSHPPHVTSTPSHPSFLPTSSSSSRHIHLITSFLPITSSSSCHIHPITSLLLITSYSSCQSSPNHQLLCPTKEHIKLKFKLLYKLGTLNFITSFYFMVLKGTLRTDTITFFRDSNRLLSDVLRFQRDLRYVSGLRSTYVPNICSSVVTIVKTSNCEDKQEN